MFPLETIMMFLFRRKAILIYSLKIPRKNEVKNYVPPPKSVKELVGVDKEINLSKMNTLNDIDDLIFHRKIFICL